MQKNIRDSYPNWTNEINSNKYNIGFTADMDGLLCSAFARHHLGLEVNKFYDFRRLYTTDQSDKRETIYFDCAITKGKTFDNHFTRLGKDTPYNEQSANINNVTGVHVGRYTDKFAMSTLIQLYAIYDIPLPSSLQGKLILLCCDVGFKGYYNADFRDTFLHYLKVFDMMELVEVLEQFSVQQMYEIMLRAQMNMSIHQQNGLLSIHMNNKNPYGAKWFNFETGMDLDWFTQHLGYPVELPRQKFEVVETFTTKTIDTWEISQYINQNLFSYAFINKNKTMLSIGKDKGESR